MGAYRVIVQENQSRLAKVANRYTPIRGLTFSKETSCFLSDQDRGEGVSAVCGMPAVHFRVRILLRT